PRPPPPPTRTPTPPVHTPNYDPRMKREGLHYVVVERDENYMASFDEMVPEFIEKRGEAEAGGGGGGGGEGGRGREGGGGG
ncbi:hypothetical protein NQU33_26525, partial [Escherichia coli]|nr:hypothetical protein [Escherichia coli]